MNSGISVTLAAVMSLALLACGSSEVRSLDDVGDNATAGDATEVDQAAILIDSSGDRFVPPDDEGTETAEEAILAEPITDTTEIVEVIPDLPDASEVQPLDINDVTPPDDIADSAAPDTPDVPLPDTLFVLANDRFPSDPTLHSHRIVPFRNPEGTLFLIETFAASKDIHEQPIGYRWDAVGLRFVRADGDAVAGEPPLLPDIPGNYAGLDVGLIDDDPCPDLVFGAQMEKDMAASTPDVEVDRGVPNFILFQVRNIDGTCAGTFAMLDDTIAKPARRYDYDIDQGVPRPTLTKAVNLFDADGDGDLDLYVVNMIWPLVTGPGANVGDQFFMNDGTGVLTEAKEFLPPLATNLSAWAVTSCDIDGDGDIDLIETGRATYGTGTARDRILVNQLRETGSLAFVDEAEARGMPMKFWTGRALCLDLTGDQADASGASAKDLLMPISGILDLYYYENDGSGLFTARPEQWDPLQWTNTLAACDLLGDGGLEVVAGVGHWSDSSTPHYGHPELFERSAASGRWTMSDPAGLGFKFHDLEQMTFHVECLNVDGLPGDDIVILANRTMQDQFYIRKSLIDDGDSGERFRKQSW